MRSLLLFLTLMSLASCASRPTVSPVESYLEADRTIAGTVLSPAAHEAAVGRFKAFFADVTADSARKLVKGLYAPDAFFNDTLKTVRGNEAIEAYFLKAASHTDFIRAEVVDVARSGPNTYLRWVMDVRYKGSKETVRTVGMTHLRFAPDGRIALHQDFWDSTTGFFEHLPVLGPLIRWIKSKI